MKFTPLMLLVFMSGCANPQKIEWTRAGNKLEQNNPDLIACNNLAVKLIPLVKRRTSPGAKVIDIRNDELTNDKNRKKVIEWCLENRGYTVILNDSSDR